MSNWKRYDRREMLNLLSMLGAMGAVSLLLGGCAPVTLCSGVRKVTGEVLINGQRITSKQLTATGRLKVPNDASLSTGPDGSAVFVVGKDAFLLHKNSRVVLTPAASTKPNEISGFQLSFGAILSVFARGKRMLRTPTAVIAIRGTGAYLESDSEKTYICTCYGTSHLQIKETPGITETVTTQHHEAPRFIYAAEKRIALAPMFNHSDQELMMLEELVGRVPPFLKSDGSVHDEYEY